ncbi:hypothetical protein [Ekhidna sp.]|uniref:hypothetical protein n=1 Tax=Ekhidna sp. TaxID=2608089 RepID=UPI003CCB87D4
MRTLWATSILIFLASCAVNKSTNTFHPFNGNQVSCGNFIAYKLTDDNDEYVSVSFSASEVDFTESQVFGIGKAKVLEVRRKKYNGPISSTLCNDVMPAEMPDKVSDEVATSGLVEILLSQEDIEKAKNGQPYSVTIILKDVQFTEMTIDYLRIEKTNVGWLPG